MDGENGQLREFGKFRVDTARKVLWHERELVPMPLKELELLCLLVAKQGEIVTKDELLTAIWPDSFVEESNLSRHVYLVRKTLRKFGGKENLIENVARRGYRFTGEVREIVDDHFIIERHAVTRTLIEEVPTGMGSSEQENRIIDGQNFAARDMAEALRHRIGTPLMAVIIIAAAAAGGYSVWLSNRLAAKTNFADVKSIAVMPFVNENGGEDVEYLADGMTESIISSVSQLSDIAVKARSSVFHYKGKNVSPAQLMSELNVQAILNGRIMHGAGQMHMFLTLVDARTENVIWSKQYNRKLTDLVSLQNEIARDISGSLRRRLSGAEQQKLTRDLENTDAYQLYLKGRYHWNKRNPTDLQKSIEYFDQSIAADKNYAPAYAGLALAYPLLASYVNLPTREVIPKARDAALKAISLDDGLAEAHAALGLILHGYDYDYVGAEREYKLAIELNPNYATAHQFYGEMLGCLGKHDEAIAEMRQALDIDPLSLIVNRMYGESLYYARRYDEAAIQLKKTIDLDSGFYTAHAILAYVYHVRGQYAESVEEFAKTHEAIGETDKASLMRASFAKNGWPGFLRFMTGEQRPKTLPMSNVAVFLDELGERDKAVSVLDDIYEDRSYMINWINIDPRFDNLRDDPRFQSIVRKLNLAG